RPPSLRQVSERGEGSRVANRPWRASWQPLAVHPPSPPSPPSPPDSPRPKRTRPSTRTERGSTGQGTGLAREDSFRVHDLGAWALSASSVQEHQKRHEDASARVAVAAATVARAAAGIG